MTSTLRYNISKMLALLTAAVAIVSLFILPDMAAVQWNAGGEVVNLLSRHVTVMICAAVGCVCILLWNLVMDNVV